MNKFLKIHKNDNVVVAMDDLAAGTVINVDGEEIVLSGDVKRAHKIAISPIKAGEKAIKYGYPIGIAKQDIAKGDWVHVHNIKTGLGEILDYKYEPSLNNIPPQKPRTFKGFVRTNGDVGIRNEIWIIPTVGCVNSNARVIAEKAKELVKDKCDGVFYFGHPFGCSQMGDDQLTTQKLLAALVNHPNAAAVLVLGLGCENNNIKVFKNFLGDIDENRVKFLVCQDVEDEIEEDVKIIEQLADYASTFKRQEVPVSKLTVGLKCGGSDGFSGITANPLVGRFSDMLIAQGGSSILTEVPEMFGAETILMNRCKDKETFDKTVNLINSFKDYFIKHEQVVYENPSPGNKDGGISTLEDKSLGCTQKGGDSTVVDVLDYAQRVVTPGLNLLKSPGNDLVAATALSASGAHLILFTTGRGTPFGAPAPTVKISTNTPLYNKKGSWIDFNAGPIAEGISIDDLANELFEYIIKLASGEIKTKTEINNFREISIFKDGVVL